MSLLAVAVLWLVKLKTKPFWQTLVGKLKINLAAVHGAIQLAMKLEHKFELTVYFSQQLALRQFSNCSLTH